MMTSGNVVSLNSKRVDKPVSPIDNGDNGGGGNMNNKFVTHTELELSNQKLLRHID